jgi:hypothetical protein
MLSGCADTPTESIDDNPFVGTWLLTHFNGAPIGGGITWFFTEVDVTVRFGSDSLTGTYSYDPADIPRSIDVSIIGAAPNPNLGIYEFPTSTTLVLQLMDGATGRATDFEVHPDYDLEQFTKQ